MSDNNLIQSILSKYNFQQINKIQDFLISEIDVDTLQETIDFVQSSDMEKGEKFKEILYVGDVYEGLNIEGNQYLLSSTQCEVLIIDMVSEENGVGEKSTRITMPILDFIHVISNKKMVIKLIKEQQGAE